MVTTNAASEFYIALGSNLSVDEDEPKQVLQKAMEGLTEHDVQILAQSRFYSTPAFPAGSGPEFVNAAAKVAHLGSAENLMSILHAVEANFGRLRDQRWSARVLDLDLIAAEDLVLPNLERFEYWRNLDVATQMTATPEELILPHPRLQDRSFVLVPMLDIAPEWRHPVLQKTIQELADLRPLEERESVRVL